MSQLILSPQSQIQDAACLSWLRENRCRIGDAICEIAFYPTFADWLRWLEHDEHLLRKESGSPQNFVWAKGLLQRWREAGRPYPGEWPETSGMIWLRPRYSHWPDLSSS